MRDNHIMFYTTIVSRGKALSRLLAYFLCVLVTVTGSLSYAQNTANSSDGVFLEMSQAFQKNDRKRLQTLLPQAKGHLLEPWAAYWELKVRMDDASTSEIKDFLNRYAGTYQEDRLRNDWLLLLGSRKEWGMFDQEYPLYRMRDDKEVECFAALVEYNKVGRAISDAWVHTVRTNWMAMRQADEGCTWAAEALYQSHKFNDMDIWRKVRLSTEYNRPKTARNAFKIISSNELNTFDDIQNNAMRFLTRASSKTKSAFVALALIKVASNDADAAAKQMESPSLSHLNAEEKAWVWSVIGRQAAGKLNDKSFTYFAKANTNQGLTDEMLAWKVRSALRAGETPQWVTVEAAIAGMNSDYKRDPIWVYWQARALMARKPTLARTQEDARTLLQSIAGVQGFYEQLAMEELGQKITKPIKPEPLGAGEISAVRSNVSLQRALKAIAVGIRPDGVREWNYATSLVDNQGKSGRMTDREMLAAAQWACEQSVWDRCINTSDRSKLIDFELRFPMPFKKEVIQRSKEINLDPAYVYGLIRQESRFIMDARSHVGASGLMQVMPATAKWTAKKIGLTGFRPEHITQHDTNIAIGTGYLKLVLESFEGSMPMAAAAYNAGPSRPRKWREGAFLEGAIWAENLPFNETRDYVKKVLSNTTNYAAIITGEPQSLKERLGRVGPRNASAPPESEELP
jgi:soluble lytic murein transglycosylase